MKFNKEILLKQRFWILLSLSLVIALSGIFVLLTAVGAHIASERGQLESKLSEINKTLQGDTKNESWVAVRAKEAADWEQEKAKVWKRAFEAQEKIITWPEAFDKYFRFNSGLFALDIVIERKGEAPAEPFKNDDSHFQGTVTHKEKDFITVVGQDKREKTFFRTDRGTVTLNSGGGGQKASFLDIRSKDQVRVTFEQGRYFNDPLTDSEQNEYTRTYHSQIKDIIELVQPVDSKGNGVVQLKGWPADDGWFGQKDKWPPKEAKFFSYVAGDWNIANNISEEAWMAQEDLWIQRELYRLVRLANDYVAKFKGPGGAGKNWQKFTNPYWQLELRLADARKLEVKIRNLLDRRQKLDLSFRVRFDPKGPLEKISLGYKPRDPYGSKKQDEKTGEPTDSYTTQIELAGGVSRSGVYEVEQVLTWETAAVKRIDQVSIGNVAAGDCAHSHRTFPEGVRPLKKEEKVEAPAGEGGGPGGDKVFMPPGLRPGQPGGPGQGGFDKGNRTNNGLISDRYLEVTPQARRLPVALVLIVDQDHVDRVQTAFANSHLRFLPTQVILSRYPNSLRPNLALTGEMPAGGEGGKFMPPGPGPGPVRPPMPPGPMGVPVRPPGLDSPAEGQASGGGDEQESNMEFVIYGILTFYERYPPRVIAPVAAEAKE